MQAAAIPTTNKAKAKYDILQPFMISDSTGKLFATSNKGTRIIIQSQIYLKEVNMSSETERKEAAKTCNLV